MTHPTQESAPDRKRVCPGKTDEPFLPRWAERLCLLAAILFLASGPATAVNLDDEGLIRLRARVYSQASIRIEDSSLGTEPGTQAGQLVQHRNFFNPELDGVLTSHLSWLRDTPLAVLQPDDLSFRVVAWGFYDGIYDYGASQFDRNRTAASFSPAKPPPAGPGRALFLEGPELAASVDGRILGANLEEVFPDNQKLDARRVYAERLRLNELYLSYEKGPFFLRLGRQTISWGESDTIALLDQNNPFDITVAAPGIFLDLDEARIPLWTVRTSYRLFDRIGPLSDGSVEAYWVPGDLDTNTGFTPILAVSPYSPRGPDPQLNLPCSIGLCNQLRFTFFDHVPASSFENSRWGVRFHAVVAHQHTLSAWYYTHFPNTPVPRRAGVTDQAIDGYPLVVTELYHDLTGTFGVADSFFFEPLDGIVRFEAEYFPNEPAFIPDVSFGQLDNFFAVGSVPRADFLRWEIGFDRFFFVRPLNPTNAFTLVSALVGSWNTTETGNRDFRQNQLRPGYYEKPQGSAPAVDDFVQLEPVEAFVQTTLQTEYLHGRLTPQLTTIFHTRGTYLIRPEVQYRWSDWLLFGMDIVHIGGAYQGFGFFRDRDQVSVRVTYQLN